MNVKNKEHGANTNPYIKTNQTNPSLEQHHNEQKHTVV